MKWHRRGRKYWEGLRARVLANDGFLPIEIHGSGSKEGLKSVTFGKSKWFNRVRRQRRRELVNMIKESAEKKKTKRQVRREWTLSIVKKYVGNGWLLANGKIDPWQMFRDMRAAAIRRGEWVETPRRAGSGRRVRQTDHGLVRIDKGNVREQRARYREKQRQLKATGGSSWFSQK